MKKVYIAVLIVLASILPIQANTRVNVEFKKCTDGDTAHFILDGKDTTVRFLAINAPEYTKEKEPYGKEASAYVCDVITNAKQVALEFDDGSDRTDKYGRTLAWVYADGVLVQKELVKQGLAEVKYLYGDYAYTDDLKQAEKEAKKQKLNMWSEVEPQDDELPVYVSAAGGILLILAGLFVVKGKRNRSQLVKKGIRQLRK